jgi:hypothetical protein
MSGATTSTAGVLLITVAAIAYGGYSLLRFLTRRTPGYMDNPLRQNLFRAGHAHAGVLVMLALIALPYIDASGLGDGLKGLVRAGFTLPPILMPLGFFLSVAPPGSERPNRLILATYAGAVVLVAAVLTLGISLI